MQRCAFVEELHMGLILSNTDVSTELQSFLIKWAKHITYYVA
jgi:hypothetical protein